MTWSVIDIVALVVINVPGDETKEIDGKVRPTDIPMVGRREKEKEKEKEIHKRDARSFTAAVGVFFNCITPASAAAAAAVRLIQSTPNTRSDNHPLSLSLSLVQ